METDRTGQRKENADETKSIMAATYESALKVGLPIISMDNSARILAVLYVHGNNEFMVHSDKFNVERDYIQKRFKIEGGEKPDPIIIPRLKQYIKELEAFEKEYPDQRYPEWADKLFRERYGFRLIN